MLEKRPKEVQINFSKKTSKMKFEQLLWQFSGKIFQTYSCTTAILYLELPRYLLQQTAAIGLASKILFLILRKPF